MYERTYVFTPNNYNAINIFSSNEQYLLKVASVYCAHMYAYTHTARRPRMYVHMYAHTYVRE